MLVLVLMVHESPGEVVEVERRVVLEVGELFGADGFEDYPVVQRAEESGAALARGGGPLGAARQRRRVRQGAVGVPCLLPSGPRVSATARFGFLFLRFSVCCGCCCCCCCCLCLCFSCFRIFFFFCSCLLCFFVFCFSASLLFRFLLYVCDCSVCFVVSTKYRMGGGGVASIKCGWHRCWRW